MAVKKKKKSSGRKSSYDPKIHPDLAAKLKQDGKTNTEVAEMFGVSLSTIRVWIRTHPEFGEAIKTGREIMVSKVHKSLYESCFEHTVTERRVIKKRNENGEMVAFQAEVFERVIPANILAIQILLYNCDPEHFRRNPSPAADKSKDPLMALLEGIKDRQKGGDADDERDAEGDKADTVPEADRVVPASDGTP